MPCASRHLCLNGQKISRGVRAWRRSGLAWPPAREGLATRLERSGADPRQSLGWGDFEVAPARFAQTPYSSRRKRSTASVTRARCAVSRARYVILISPSSGMTPWMAVANAACAALSACDAAGLPFRVRSKSA